MSNTAYVTEDELPQLRKVPVDLPVVRASELPTREGSQQWLIEGLWGSESVGFVGGKPKVWKTWLVLEMAIAVATGKPCLGIYAVPSPGKVLLFLAEDEGSQVRARLQALCHARGVVLNDLDVHFITASRLELNRQNDFERLESVIKSLQPKLLVLDPFVRVFSGDEDDSGHVSRVLGRLRQLQREHRVAVGVVHHFKKGKNESGGDALRGSSDMFAWADSALFLRRQADRVRVEVQHRAAPSPASPTILLTEADGGLRLDVVADDEQDADAPPPERDLKAEVVTALRAAAGALGHGELRVQLRVRNERVGELLAELEKEGVIRRHGREWQLVPDSVPVDA